MSLFRFLFLGIVNKIYNIVLWFIDMALFFRYPFLWHLWFLLFSHYPFGAWLFLRESITHFTDSELDLTYGETPFFTAQNMLDWAKITAQDKFLDLGSGTGRVVFLASMLYGVKGCGIEMVGGMTEVAKIIAKKLTLQNVVFQKGDFLDHDLSNYTIIYIAGTTFKESTRKELAQKTASLPKGARVISVSKPIRGPSLSLIDSKNFYFSWGKGTVFLEQRI